MIKYIYLLLLILFITSIVCQITNKYYETFDYSKDIFNKNIKTKNKTNKITKKDFLDSPWKNFCIGIDYREPILWADCKDYYGHYKHSSINLKNCTSKIYLEDGNLRCN